MSLQSSRQVSVGSPWGPAAHLEVRSGLWPVHEALSRRQYCDLVGFNPGGGGRVTLHRGGGGTVVMSLFQQKSNDPSNRGMDFTVVLSKCPVKPVWITEASWKSNLSDISFLWKEFISKTIKKQSLNTLDWVKIGPRCVRWERFELTRIRFGNYLGPIWWLWGIFARKPHKRPTWPRETPSPWTGKLIYNRKTNKWQVSYDNESA